MRAVRSLTIIITIIRRLTPYPIVTLVDNPTILATDLLTPPPKLSVARYGSPVVHTTNLALRKRESCSVKRHRRESRRVESTLEERDVREQSLARLPNWHGDGMSNYDGFSYCGER